VWTQVISRDMRNACTPAMVLDMATLGVDSAVSDPHVDPAICDVALPAPERHGLADVAVVVRAHPKFVEPCIVRHVVLADGVIEDLAWVHDPLGWHEGVDSLS